MGNRHQSLPQYRDELDADAVSLHTTRSDYEYDAAQDPPPYSDNNDAPSPGNSVDDALPHPSTADPFPRVQPSSRWLQTSNGKVQNNQETSIRMDARLEDPDELQKYVADYIASVPPRPWVRVVGTHQETTYNSSTKKNEKSTVVDFDISFNLQFELKGSMRQAEVVDNSDSVHRGGWRRTRAQGYKQSIEVGHGDKFTLQEWCHDYCDNKASLKIFRVTRNITGFDAGYLHGQIEHLVRSTNYRGHLDVSFPVEEKNIDIYSPHWINRWRISWVRFLFYITFLWLITWPVLFFTTKRWAVYNVEWPWSTTSIDSEGRAVKRYHSTSEAVWFRERVNLIRSLVVERYQGDATSLPTNVQEPRLHSTGNANVDALVSSVQGGVNVWNTLQGRGSSLGWGADS